MATNTVVINSVIYQDVKEINIPKSPSGTAKFHDVSDATITGGGQMLDGVSAYDASGTKITGTIVSKAGTDLTVTGDTVTVPAGYYSSQVTKAVASGSASAPSTISGTSASLSAGTNSLTLTKSVSVTPVVSAGFVTSGTATNTSVSLTASVTTKAAATITPGTSNQEIAAGTYLTGKQTISGDSNLQSQYIKSGVSIFGVSGSLSSATVSQDSITKVLSIS